MTKCPYCGHKINTTKELPEMNPREFRVYNTLLNNGRDYTSQADLLLTINNNGEEGKSSSLRVVIHYLNKKIVDIGQTIVCHRKVGYRLEEA